MGDILKLYVGQKVKVETEHHPSLKKGQVVTVKEIGDMPSSAGPEYQMIFIKEIEKRITSFIYIMHISAVDENIQLELF